MKWIFVFLLKSLSSLFLSFHLFLTYILFVFFMPFSITLLFPMVNTYIQKKSDRDSTNTKRISTLKIIPTISTLKLSRCMELADNYDNASRKRARILEQSRELVTPKPDFLLTFSCGRY